jgi:proline iminopeptidase
MRSSLRAGLLAGLLSGLSACSAGVRSTTIHLPDGQALFVRAVGSGRDTVLVLHHGPGLHGGYLVPELERLGPAHTFLLYDQRGRGRSDPTVDTTRLSVAQDLADLDAVRTHFHLDRPALLGHGYGALLAALYALDHPRHVSRLLLVGPMFPRAIHSWGVVMYAYEMPDSLALLGLDSARASGLDRKNPEAFCRRFWGAWLSPAAVRDRVTVAALGRGMCDAPPAALARVESVGRAVLRSLGNWDVRARLADLAIPTLVVQGLGTASPDSSAAVVWRTAAREWTLAVPHSGVVFLPAPAQFPWIGREQAFLRAASTFLNGDWPAEARAPRGRLAAQ